MADIDHIEFSIDHEGNVRYDNSYLMKSKHAHVAGKVKLSVGNVKELRYHDKIELYTVLKLWINDEDNDLCMLLLSDEFGVEEVRGAWNIANVALWNSFNEDLMHLCIET